MAWHDCKVVPQSAESLAGRIAYLELAAGHLHAVEIKRSLSAPRPSKGFHLACDDLKVRGRWVVYPGRERYRLDARTEVVPFTETARPDFRWAPESR
jgi:hypothetical protein